MSILWGSAALLLLLLLCSGWLAVRANAARHHLERARSTIDSLERAIRASDVRTANRDLSSLQSDSAAARRLTHDPVWTAAGLVPWLGDTPRAVGAISQAIDTIAASALPPLVRTASALTPATVLSGGNHVDVAAIAAARPDLDVASAQVARAQAMLPGRHGLLLGPVAAAVREARDNVRRLRSLTTNGALAARLLPPMLGGSGRRSYLVVVQNPAEARGTGGLIGAYAVVEADRGGMRLREIGSNTRLDSARRPVIDLGPDFRTLYGADPGFWSNANLSPHFPYAARLWLSLWHRQFGERLDGVVTMDPVALGDLVGATGPVRVNATTELTRASTAAFFMRDIYALYPRGAQNDARDQLANRLGSTIVRRILAGRSDPRLLVDAVTRAADHGRALVYSAHGDEQTALARTRVSGELVGSGRPDVTVVINNGGGNKLDYYLDRTVTYALGACRTGDRNNRLTVTLTNHAPAAGLPEWVKGNPLAPVNGTTFPPGTNRALVYVYATAGSHLRSASVEGASLRVRYGAERGHPVFAFPLDVAPGQTRAVRLDLIEPARPRDEDRPHIVEQPLARAQHSRVTGPVCPS